MKKYAQFQCSVCKRERDDLVDVGHYSPDKCTITLGCEGRLSIIGYTNDNSNTSSVAPTGLTNWYARGSVVSTGTTLKPELLYNTSTGSKQQVVLAVQKTLSTGYAPTDSAVVTVNFVVEQQSTRDYRQYTYRKSNAIQIINGVEDGLAKKVLRYSVTGLIPDQIEVYVNGVKKNQGTASDEYSVFDGVSNSPPNSIYFNTPLTGTSNQIDVVVTKAATLSTAQIVFTRAIYDESRIGTGAWEGVDNVSSLNETWHLFYADVSEITSFPLDVKLRVSSATITDNNIVSQIGDPSIFVASFAPQPMFIATILLSRENAYTQVDRLKAVHIPLFNLDENNGYMIMKLTQNVRTLYVTEDAVTQVFPPYTSALFGSHKWKLLSTGLTGNSNASEIDSSLIVGPDA